MIPEPNDLLAQLARGVVEREAERAREALQEYARRREADRDTGILREFAGLIAQAKAAGQETEILALAAGRGAR